MKESTLESLHWGIDVCNLAVYDKFGAKQNSIWLRNQSENGKYKLISVALHVMLIVGFNRQN